MEATMKALTTTHRNAAPTAAPVEPRAALPAPLTDTRAAEIVLAASRFTSRPEIAECIFAGSNGAVARLPASLDRRLDLLDAWPDARRCMTFAAQIDRALAEPARADEVAAAVAATLRMFPTGDRAGLGFSEGVAAFVTEECATRKWSMAALTGGLIALTRSCRFLPAVAEVIEAIAQAQRDLRHTAWAARQAAELGEELRWSLIDAGMVEIEDDGEDF